jgi:hypothetical protein
VRFLVGDRRLAHALPLATPSSLPAPSRTEVIGRKIHNEAERSTVVRLLEPSIQRWKLSFAVDLPPNLKTGRWRERGRH